MNVFDALLLLPVLALSLALLLSPVRTEPRQVSPRWRAWSWPAAPVPRAPLLTALLLTGLLFHLTLGVPRWQLAPAYLAAGLAMGLVVGLALGLLGAGRRAQRGWAAVAGSLLLVTLGLNWAAPLFTFPAPTGPQGIGTRVVHWQGEQRPVTAQVWYPTAERQGRRAAYLPDRAVTTALAHSFGLPGFALSHLRGVRTHALLNAVPVGGPHPTLLFFHGLGGVRQQNTFQVEELVSHGYIVVGVDVPGFAAASVDARGHVTRNTHGSASRSSRRSDEWVNEWAHTGRLVLRSLLGDPQWRTLIDPARLGAFGHSFGGATASFLLLTDPRLKAALNMDAGLFGQPQPRGGYPRPFFLMNTASGLDRRALEAQAARLTDAQISEATGGDLITRAAYLQDVNTLFQRRAQALRGQHTWSLVLPATQHVSFSDVTAYSPLLAGQENVTETHRVINTFTLAFFDEHLRQRPAHAERLLQAFPQVTFQAGPQP